MFMWVSFCIFLWTRIQIIFIMLNVVKDVGQVGNHEIILIGNRKIKRQRICHVKTANLTAANLNGVTVFRAISDVSEGRTEQL